MPRDPLPIPLAPGRDPRQVIEDIANDLVTNGTGAEDKRAGRRLLGALEALWAEDGADPDLIDAIIHLEER